MAKFKVGDVAVQAELTTVVQAVDICTNRRDVDRGAPLACDCDGEEIFLGQVPGGLLWHHAYMWDKG